ncbi:MAG: PEP-CTERM sorting domain-containing protein [Myxococcota bacterium]
MQQFLVASLVWAVFSLSPALARADQFETFYLDPARSFMQYVSGDVNAQLSITQFAFADMLDQPGVAPAPLSGHFVMQIGNDASNPTSFDILSGTTDIRPADVNTVSPGTGGAAGTTDAAFGISFLDATNGIGGDVAFHDLAFGISGSFNPVANGLGPNGLQGSMPWALVDGDLEIQTSIGIGGTAFVPFTTSATQSVDSSASQFSETSPGVYEVVIPFQFLIGVTPVAGPFSGALVRATFSGEIVATNVVPEPGSGALLGLGLLLLTARRRQGTSR